MLQGKTAIITGSTSGIGLGIARVLAHEGCGIVLNGMSSADQIKSIQEELSKISGKKITYSSADVSKPDEIRRMISEAEVEFGSVDILINNAGIQFSAQIEEFPDEKWDSIISINLSSAFHSIKSVLPGMKRRGWGRIINIASAHGLVGSPGKVAYVAAKHGIIGLTKVVALESANSGVTVNAICPGWVLTPLVEKQIQDQAKQKGIDLGEAQRQLLLEKQPMLEFTTPEKIGGLVVFLCSVSASTITGTSLSIDGGWTAR